MSRSARSSARRGLWSRDRGCYVVGAGVIAGREGASRLFAGRLLASDALEIQWSVRYDLRSRSSLSSLALQTASALFPPLRSHLGLCKLLLIIVDGQPAASAIGLSVYVHLLWMRWGEREKDGRLPELELTFVLAVCGRGVSGLAGIARERQLRTSLGRSPTVTGHFSRIGFHTPRSNAACRNRISIIRQLLGGSSVGHGG